MIQDIDVPCGGEIAVADKDKPAPVAAPVAAPAPEAP